MLQCNDAASGCDSPKTIPRAACWTWIKKDSAKRKLSQKNPAQRHPSFRLTMRTHTHIYNVWGGVKENDRDHHHVVDVSLCATLSSVWGFLRGRPVDNVISRVLVDETGVGRGACGICARWNYESIYWALSCKGMLELYGSDVTRIYTESV